jgi:hypothetical protein
VRLFWNVGDLYEALHLSSNPWRRAGTLAPATPPDLSMFGPRAG